MSHRSVIVDFPGKPGAAAPPPTAAELRRRQGRARGAWSASPWLGDGQNTFGPALLHEPHHEDNPVGRPKKGEIHPLHYDLYFDWG